VDNSGRSCGAHDRGLRQLLQKELKGRNVVMRETVWAFFEAWDWMLPSPLFLGSRKVVMGEIREYESIEIQSNSEIHCTYSVRKYKYHKLDSVRNECTEGK
jgi:hypothetical protein